jgi:Domain of unknown function (DUF4157)
MYTSIIKGSENKSQLSDYRHSGKEKSTSRLQFANNRPEAIVMLKLQEAANNSPQVNSMRQLQAMSSETGTQKALFNPEKRTSLPYNLKLGMENLSGYSLDDVRVHYNSDRPAQLQAYAYAQGIDIHVAPGQEKHLAHEAWHVVQQKQGRVKPTTQMKGKVNVNDDASLEKEADAMGSKAMQLSAGTTSVSQMKNTGIQGAGFLANGQVSNEITQLKTNINHDTTTFDAQSKGTGDFSVGVGMQAELDPAFPVIGSATSMETTSKLGSICKLFNPGLEQTHLLNADLGGFGVYENLYPMTPKANREHYNKVERHVKEALFKAAKNYWSKVKIPEDEGTGIYYDVSVQGTHSFSGLKDGTVFNCEAYFIDDVKTSPIPNKKKKIVKESVVSAPLTDGNRADFQGRNVVMNWWNHKQGEANPNATKNQQNFISKREGKADLANKFSKYTVDKTWDDYRLDSISVDSDLINDKIDILQSIVFKNYETAKLLGSERFNNDIYTLRLDAILDKIKNTDKHVILNSFEYVKECVTKDEKETFEKIREDDKVYWSSLEEVIVLDEEDEF